MNRYKRLASTPPQVKNEKQNDQYSTPEQTTEAVFDSSILPLTTSTSTGSAASQATAKSLVSAHLLLPQKTLDPRLIDGKPGMFYRGKCNIVEIEINHIDGKPYTTNMRSSDAIRHIYMGALKLDKNQIIGVQVSWKGKPFISFRLKTKIDKLEPNFSYITRERSEL